MTGKNIDLEEEIILPPYVVLNLAEYLIKHRKESRGFVVCKAGCQNFEGRYSNIHTLLRTKLSINAQAGY